MQLSFVFLLLLEDIDYILYIISLLIKYARIVSYILIQNETLVNYEK